MQARTGRPHEAATATGRRSGATGAAADAGAEAAAAEDEAQGQPEAVDGHDRAATRRPGRPPPRRPARAPARALHRADRGGRRPGRARAAPSVEGGFDFFGTQKAARRSDALDAVQNEDLADVVGQEALALHKAESESGVQAGRRRGRAAVGQVIDLTAHDETEQIDLQGLRSAAS